MNYNQKEDTPSATIWSSLCQEGEQFDFFQAVRLIELIHSAKSSNHQSTMPDKPTERIRFRSHVGLQFPTHDIQKIINQPNKDHWPSVTMVVNFLGLHGTSGLLPRYYTELLLQLLQRKQTALRDFFDLYNHRLISLFYQSWEKNHLHVGYEKTKNLSTNPDPLSNMLAALTGTHFSQSSPRSSETILYFSNYFANPRRSSTSLGDLLSNYFSTPVCIKSRQLRKIKLPLSEKTRLGTPQNNYNVLGVNTLLGNYVRDCQLFFRIVIGPLTYQEFQTFSPHQTKYWQLIELTKKYIAPVLEFDVQLLINPSEIPRWALGKQKKLGWDTWLCAKYHSQNAVVISPYPQAQESISHKCIA